jgi:guanylate kinase
MGTILVVSGPSGSGKTSLARSLVGDNANAYFSISTTTRTPRNGEKDGYDYFFTTKEEFLRQIDLGLFLEWAEVHGNFYGTSLEPINQALTKDKLVLFDIDVQGHRLIREKFGDVVTSVFVTTSNVDVLQTRLKSRQSESDEQIQKRISNAFEEMGSINEYDYLLINDDFDSSLESLVAIARSAQFKCAKVDLQAFVMAWQNY